MTNTILILLFLTTTALSLTSSCHVNDLKALTTFKNSFPNEPFPTWIADCCNWGPVYCDDITGRVTSFQMFPYGNRTYANVVGPIPLSLFDLAYLETLVLSDLIGLSGPIPPQITKLQRLSRLSISKTRISGPIPSFLSKLPSLLLIDLSHNRFSGPIPSSIGTLANLSVVEFQRNRLTGTIPASLHPNVLVLSYNNLTGKLPPSFADAAFSDFEVGHNGLEGDASFLFGEDKDISTIDISFNKFKFDLTNITYSMFGLHDVKMSHNEIYGSINEQIMTTGVLARFDCSYNQLCGKIPGEGKFARYHHEAKNFEHNKCLCGAPLQPCK